MNYNYMQQPHQNNFYGPPIPSQGQGQGQGPYFQYPNPYASAPAPVHAPVNQGQGHMYAPAPGGHPGVAAVAYGQGIQEIKNKFKYDRRLFEDPAFPANDSSLYFPGGIRPHDRVHWRRPGELVKNPRFFADGVSRFDVIQGELGNCWLVAAVANLTIQKNYFLQVVPNDNSFNPGDYCGAFHFRFWQYGDWIDVVVDDRLPCNSRGQLLYLHSQDKNEFWSALLEKAYAKLHGSYGSLAGGSPSEAMQDFTGGIVELVDVKEVGRNLFTILRKAFTRQAMMTCALNSSKSGYREEKTSTGLVRGHAYSITSVREIRIYSGGLVQLVRVRNPWGDHFEWNGPWSDRSREWDMVDSSTKASLEWSKQNDGEFWMSIQDLQRQFDRVEICHLGPDPVNAHGSPNGAEWDKVIVRGTWSRATRTAGGCINHHDTYEQNPQYVFHFEASDQDGDGNKCTVVISLVQKEGNRTDRKKWGGKDSFHIGFRVYRIPEHSRGRKHFDSNFFRENCRSSFSSGSYIDTREISGRFELPSGDYCIVPTTYKPNEEGEFLLRIYSEPQPPPRHQAYSYSSGPPAPAPIIPAQPSNPAMGGIGWGVGQLGDAFNNSFSLNSNVPNGPPGQNQVPYPNYPPVPPQSNYPPVPSQSSYPLVPSQSSYPPVPSQSSYPPVPLQSSYPPVPSPASASAPSEEPPGIGWVFDTIKES